jgi:hypothetical protein
MAGEIQLNGTTALTESSGAITLNNVNSATNRTNLGLGTAATSAVGDFATSTNLSDHAAVTSGVHGISAFGATLVDDADASTARTTLGLGTAATSASTAFTSSSTTITAGTGLSGGGDLSANRTLNVSFSANESNVKTAINASGSAPIYACRAWINFDGTSASIGTGRANGNVSGVTDHGTGDYTISFATAMPDANYSVCGSTGFVSNGVMGGFLAPHRIGTNGNESAPSTTAVRVNALYPNTTFNAKYFSVAIFR